METGAANTCAAPAKAGRTIDLIFFIRPGVGKICSGLTIFQQNDQYGAIFRRLPQALQSPRENAAASLSKV